MKAAQVTVTKNKRMQFKRLSPYHPSSQPRRCCVPPKQPIRRRARHVCRPTSRPLSACARVAPQLYVPSTLHYRRCAVVFSDRFVIYGCPLKAYTQKTTSETENTRLTMLHQTCSSPKMYYHETKSQHRIISRKVKCFNKATDLSRRNVPLDSFTRDTIKIFHNLFAALLAHISAPPCFTVLGDHDKRSFATSRRKSCRKRITLFLQIIPFYPVPSPLLTGITLVES